MNLEAERSLHRIRGPGCGTLGVGQADGPLRPGQPSDSAVGLAVQCADPDEMTQFIDPVVPGARFQSCSARGFRCHTQAFAFPRSSVLSIEMRAGRARVPESRGFVSLTIPLLRGMDVRAGRHEYHFAPGFGHVTAFLDRVSFAPVSESHVVALLFNDEHLAAHVAEPGDSIASVIGALPIQLDLTRDAGRNLLDLCRSLIDPFPESSGIGESSGFVAEAESEMLGLFLEACHAQTGYSSTLSWDAARVDRTEEFMRSSLAEPITLIDLAAVSGTSVRTLTRWFGHCFGVSPMRFLRALRLDATRRELTAARYGEATVTQAALRQGLPHLGRFALDYRERFAESPSETLRREP